MSDTVKRRGPGYFVQSNRLIDFWLPLIGESGLALYTVLNRYADKNHEAFPGVPRLARQLKVVDRTIQRTLRKLERVGLVEICPQYEADGNNRQRSNLYIILDPNNNPVLRDDTGHATTCHCSDCGPYVATAEAEVIDESPRYAATPTTSWWTAPGHKHHCTCDTCKEVNEALSHEEGCFCAVCHIHRKTLAKIRQ